MRERYRLQLRRTAGCIPAIAFVIALLASCGTSDARTWHDKWDVPIGELAPIFRNPNCSRLEATIEHRVQQMRVTTRDEHLVHSVVVQAAFSQMVALACDQAYRP